MSSQTLGGKDACATEKILFKPINSAQWAQLVSCSKVKKPKRKYRTTQFLENTCLKITQNVAFEFINDGISQQFLFYQKRPNW